MADGYWAELWEDWFRPLSKDILKTLSILAILFGFWEFIALMRLRGYPDVYLDKLDKTHFAFMWALLVVVSGSFVVKQFMGLWSNKRRKR